MKGKCLAGVILGYFFLSLSLLASDEKPICSYFEALTLFQQEKFEEGLKKYYKYLLLCEPILSIESRKADLQEAKTYLENQYRLSPNNSQVRLYLSLYDRIVQDWTSACKRIDDLLRKFQKASTLYFFKGEYLLAQSKTDEASKAFEKLKNDTGKKKLWLLAKLLQKHHGLNAGTEERKNALLQKGLRHLDLFENEEAVKVLQQVMSEFPDDPRAPHELMDFFIRENRLHDAEMVLVTWRKRDPDGRELYFPEARLKFKQERYPEVLKILTPLLSADPNNIYVRFMIAESSFMSENYEKALEFLPSLQESDPNNIGLLFRRTASLEMTNNASEAVALLSGALKQYPRNDHINLELGSVYERMGDYQNARTSYLAVVNGNEALGTIAQKRFVALQEIQTKGQRNSDTILATMFLDEKGAQKEQPETVAPLPSPPLIKKILEEQKEILDILSQS